MRPRLGNVCSDHGFRSKAILSMWSAAGDPFLSHRIRNCVAVRKWVALWDSGWEAEREGGRRWIGSWLGARYAGMFEEEVAEVVLKAQCAAG